MREKIFVMPIEVARDLWASLHSRKMMFEERGTPIAGPGHPFNPDEFELYTELTNRLLKLARGIEGVSAERVAGSLWRRLHEFREQRPVTWKEMTGWVEYAIQEASQ